MTYINTFLGDITVSQLVGIKREKHVPYKMFHDLSTVVASDVFRAYKQIKPHIFYTFETCNITGVSHIRKK